MYTDISDHFPIFHGCSSLRTNPIAQYITKRIYSDANIDKFVQLLQATDWNDVCQSNEPQTAYSCFHEKFHDTYIQAFPMKTFKINYRNKKPWLTIGLKACIKKKNHFYIRYNRYRTTNMEFIYKNYKKYLNNILFKAEQTHYDNLFDSYKSNMKKSWELIAEIINKQSRNSSNKGKFLSKEGLPLSGLEVANNFNNFFVNVGPTLASKIPGTDIRPLSYMNPRNEHSIFLEPVSSLEISKIIKELRNASPGWDDIHAKIMKKSCDHFIQPLTHVVICR